MTQPGGLARTLSHRTMLMIGLGSALSVILFICVLIIAALFVKGFKVDLAAGRNN